MPGLREFVGLLFIGLLLNIAVAWLCAIIVFVPPDADEQAVSIGTTHAWVITRVKKRGALWIESTRVPVHLNRRDPTPEAPVDLIPRWRRRAYLTPKFVQSAFWDAPFEERGTDARGWPLLSMWCEFQDPNNLPTSPTTGGLAVGHIPRGVWRYPDPIVLPLRVVPAGFVLNTMIYAFLGWLVWQGARRLMQVRGVVRVWRGLCPGCAYPVGHGTVCSECGARVTSRR